MSKLVLRVGLCLFALGALATFPHKAYAWYACVEATDGYTCYGRCDYYDDATGRWQGRVYYQC